MDSMLDRACRLCPRAIGHKVNIAKKQYAKTLKERTQAEYARLAVDDGCMREITANDTFCPVFIWICQYYKKIPQNLKADFINYEKCIEHA